MLTAFNKRMDFEQESQALIQAKETKVSDVMQMVKLISLSIQENNNTLQDKISTLNTEKKALEIRFKQLQEKSSGAFA